MRVLNGQASYVSAWLIVFGACQLSGAYISHRMFNIPAKVYSCYNIYFPYEVGWTTSGIILTFGLGPVIAGLFLVIFTHFVGKVLSPDTGVLREFVIWIRIHAFTMVFGNIIAGVSTGFGAAHAVKAIFGQNVATNIVVGFVCFAIFTITCMVMAKKYIIEIIPRRALADESSVKYMWASTIGSWLAGNLLIYLVVFLPVHTSKIPLQNIVLYSLTTVPPLVFMLRFRKIRFFTKTNDTRFTGKPANFSLMMFAICITGCAGWYLLFRNGIKV